MQVGKIIYIVLAALATLAIVSQLGGFTDHSRVDAGMALAPAAAEQTGEPMRIPNVHQTERTVDTESLVFAGIIFVLTLAPLGLYSLLQTSERSRDEMTRRMEGFVFGHH
ncbi:MAG: hypothetical protein WEB00_13365 [Dehalococcoidia bacterium]